MAEKKKTAAKKTVAKKPAAKKSAAKKPAAEKAAAKTREANVGDVKTLKGAGGGAKFRPTVSHMLGEIVWLMSQSQAHRKIAIGDLDRVVAPAITNGQYRVFRAGNKPVGVAFWAFVNEETDKRLVAGGGPIQPGEWKNGEILWLIEVISPSANAQNKLMDLIFADLIKNPFKGKSFRFTKTDPNTGQRQVAEFKPKEAGS